MHTIYFSANNWAKGLIIYINGPINSNVFLHYKDKIFIFAYILII